MHKAPSYQYQAKCALYCTLSVLAGVAVAAGAVGSGTFVVMGLFALFSAGIVAAGTVGEGETTSLFAQAVIKSMQMTRAISKMFFFIVLNSGLHG